MDVHRLVTHVADDNLLFFIVEFTYSASFAIWALPRRLLDEIRVEGWLVAIAMEDSTAAAALYNDPCFSLHVHLLQASLALLSSLS